MGNTLGHFLQFLQHGEAQPQPQGRRRWSDQETQLLETFVAGAGEGASVGSEVFWTDCVIPGRTDKAKRDKWRRMERT